jgi:phytoene desaturase
VNSRVIIVGAGLSGLSAGIFLQREGIGTEIFELAPWAGGMCGAWFRKGYRFDGCIQAMAGVRKDDPLYQLYWETAALTDETEIYYPEHLRFELGGALYSVPLELHAFKSFLLSLSGPEDVRAVDEFCRDVEMMTCLKLTPEAPSDFPGQKDRLKGGRGFRHLKRLYTGMTVRELADTFKSPVIAKLLKRLMPEEYAAISVFCTLGTLMSKCAGYPMGGAAGLTGRMTSRYEALGGNLRLNSKVDEIVTVNGEAKGVRSGGEFFGADGVIAACDAFDTLERLLGGRYRHPQLGSLLKSAPLYEPLAIVSFGLDRTLGIPYSLTCECPEGFNAAPGARRYGYALRSFDFDKAAAPAGGSSVMAMFEAPLEYWQKLRRDNPDSYRIQKELLADQLAAKIERRFPGFKDAVVIVDVATPATFSRLTNVYRGSFQGLAPTPASLRTPVKKILPGLRRFCLCGQWTTAGGGIGAAVAGGKTAAYMMKKDVK